MPYKKEKKNHQFLALDESRQQEHAKKTQKVKRKRKQEQIDEDDLKPAVVFLSHIPHGFYEPQMTEFFNQFGDVTRLRLARSKRTGASKGFAYIEFKHKLAAKVVVETMDGYMMFMRKLKCEMVDISTLTGDVFKGHDKHFAKNTTVAKNIMQVNKNKTGLQMYRSLKKKEMKNKKLQDKLNELGIDFNLEDVRVDSLKSEDFAPPASKKNKEENVSEEKEEASEEEKE